jgi:hypothetical protein
MMSAPGKMENRIHTTASSLPNHGINRASRNLKIFQPFARNGPRLFCSNNRPDLMPGIEKMANKMHANKTIRAGHQAFHGASFFASSCR